jgi:hypothetical protein
VEKSKAEFVVRRDWGFARSSKLAVFFQKLYNEDPAKRS